MSTKPVMWATRYLWVALLAVALLIVYVPALNNPLIFDDSMLGDGSLFASYGSLWPLQPRMLSYGSFVWIHDLFGDGWRIQRATNLILHVAVMAALWAFYREILAHIEVGSEKLVLVGQQRPTAYRDSPALGLAIAVVALNPVAVYATGYLIQRSILMATLFSTLALWNFARGCSRRRWQPFAWSLFCYLAAVASKEHAILVPLATLPVLVVALRPNRRQLAMGLLAGVALVGVIATILALRYGDILGKAFDPFSHVYLAQLAALGPDVREHAFLLSVVNQAYFFFQYGFHWLLPYSGWLSIDMRPPFPITLLSMPQVLGVVGYIGIVVGGFVLVLRCRDWRALVGVSILIPALLFATEFSTVWVQDPFVLYRSYLWAIGIPGVVLLLFHGFSSRILLIVGVCLGSLLIWQSLDRVMSMATPERLWTDAIAKHPNDPRAVGRWFPYLVRGNQYLEHRQMREAYNDFKTSSTLGDGGLGAFNVAAMLSAAGRHEQALQALDDAARAGYNQPGFAVQRGIVLAALGRHGEAVQAFDRGMAEASSAEQKADAQGLKGKSELEIGNIEAAIADLRAALAVLPTNKKARLALGMALVAKGENREAIGLFDALIAEAPYGPVYYGRGLAWYKLRNKAAALADVDEAIRMMPGNRSALELRGRIVATR